MQRARSWIRAAFAVHREWRRRARSRRELAWFDEQQLVGLGLNRSQARTESGKSFLRG